MLSICLFLGIPGAIANIEENALGCESVEQVQDSCNWVSVDERNIADKIQIYPNPSSTPITIELNIQPSKKTSLTISNTHGQQLITRTITEPQPELDISNLPTGIYIVKVWNDRDVMVRKVIKQ